jgi:hypothetical protein
VAGCLAYERLPPYGTEGGSGESREIGGENMIYVSAPEATEAGLASSLPAYKFNVVALQRRCIVKVQFLGGLFCILWDAVFLFLDTHILFGICLIVLDR